MQLRLISPPKYYTGQTYHSIIKKIYPIINRRSRRKIHRTWAASRKSIVAYRERLRSWQIITSISPRIMIRSQTQLHAILIQIELRVVTVKKTRLA